MKVAPLHGSFMLASMLGFGISLIWVYPANKGFGFAFMVVFAAMFIASIISLRKAPIDDLIKEEKLK